jgi:hypothetical protein
VRHHSLSDRRCFDLAEFEGEGGCDVALLRRCLADEELPGLAIVVGEAFRAQPGLGALLFGWEGTVAARRRFTRSFVERIRLIIHPPDRIAHRHMSILLEIREGTLRRVDRQMGEIRAAKAFQLRIQIGEVAALQQRVVAEVDARGHILRHERNLLRFGEEMIRHAIEHQSVNRLRLEDFLRDELRRVKYVEIEAVGELLVEKLDLQFPFREVVRRLNKRQAISRHAASPQRGPV